MTKKKHSSHVMPTFASALAGIFGCGNQESALLNIKPYIAYRGVVGSSFDSVEMLRIDFIESSISA